MACGQAVPQRRRDDAGDDSGLRSALASLKPLLAKLGLEPSRVAPYMPTAASDLGPGDAGHLPACEPLGLLLFHRKLFILFYWRFIAQSTAQGHLRAFTSSNLARVEYGTKHARFMNVKHTNIIRRKLVLSVLLLYKMANKVRRSW